MQANVPDKTPVGMNTKQNEENDKLKENKHKTF